MKRNFFFLATAMAILACSALCVEAASPPAGPPPVSGCLNQTVTDGFWNLKVTKVSVGTLPTNSDESALSVTFTFGPATSQALVPDSYGVGEPQVVLKDGTTLDMSTHSRIAYGQEISLFNFKPGSTKSVTYWYPSTDLLSKATTFVMPVSPTVGFQDRSVGYKVKNPAFQVDLTCDKSATQ
jgi:hypothetical protein